MSDYMMELKDFSIGTVSGAFLVGATTINLIAGHGNRFPTRVPFDIVIWNSTDYSNAAWAIWAGEAEIIKVGAKTANSFYSFPANDTDGTVVGAQS